MSDMIKTLVVCLGVDSRSARRVMLSSRSRLEVLHDWEVDGPPILQIIEFDHDIPFQRAAAVYLSSYAETMCLATEIGPIVSDLAMLMGAALDQRALQVPELSDTSVRLALRTASAAVFVRGLLFAMSLR